MPDNSALSEIAPSGAEILELGVKEADSNIFDYANGLVMQALEFWAEDRSLISYLRKAASRLDELIYGPQVRDA